MTDAITQYSTSDTFQAFCAVAGDRFQIAAMSKGMYWPIQMATPTSGTKIAVAQFSVSLVYFKSRPMMIGNARYNSDDVAIPPPVIFASSVGGTSGLGAASSGVPTAAASALSSSVNSPRNDVAVTSVNATMMYTSASQTNVRNNRYDRWLM